MTHDEVQAFCDSWLPCWSGGPKNVEPLLAHYAEDASLIDPNNAPEGIQGHDALRHFFTQMLTRYPDWAFTVEDLIPTEKGFVFLYLVDIPYLGETFEAFRGIDVMTLEGGKITKHQGYYDRSPLTLHRLRKEGRLDDAPTDLPEVEGE